MSYRKLCFLISFLRREKPCQRRPARFCVCAQCPSCCSPLTLKHFSTQQRASLLRDSRVASSLFLLVRKHSSQEAPSRVRYCLRSSRQLSMYSTRSADSGAPHRCRLHDVTWLRLQLVRLCFSVAEQHLFRKTSTLIQPLLTYWTPSTTRGQLRLCQLLVLHWRQQLSIQKRCSLEG